MPALIQHTELWAGDDRSLAAAQKIEAQLANVSVAELRDAQSDSEPNAYLLSIEGSVAVVHIKGPLINADGWLYELFRIATYPAIRAALLEAAMDNSVEQILLDIDSGGGAVAGVSDTSALIALIDENIKPVYAYTDGQMASGAYWLGCAARKIYSAKTTMIGSIGAVISLLEYSKALEKEGVTPAVIRSGKYKQVGNPLEPLSDEGRAEIQRLVDQINEVFVEHVAHHRGKPAAYVESVMGQGRVFLAKDSKEIGLIDEISTFDEVFAALSAKKVDIHRISHENNAIGVHMATNKNKKKPLTEAMRAALIEAGNVVPDAEVEVTTLDVEVDTSTDPQAQAEATLEPQAATEGEDGAVISEDKIAGASISVPLVSTDVEVELRGEVSVLTKQVEALQAQLIEAKAENKILTDAAAQTEEVITGLSAIASRSINSMNVALGGRSVDHTGRPAAEVLAEHTRVSESFKKNFKVGGVAAVQPNAAPNKQAAENDSLRAARLKAARL